MQLDLLIQIIRIKYQNDNIEYLIKENGKNYNYLTENKFIADNFPLNCNCYVKVTRY